MKLLLERWRKYQTEVLADDEDEADDGLEYPPPDNDDEELEDDEDVIDESEDDDDDDEFESVKKIKRDRAMLKPDRTSWNPGADSLRSLSRGIAERIVAEGEACGSNPYRDGSGKFSTKGSAKVYTTGYRADKRRSGDCPEQNKWSSSGGDKGTQGTYKCGRHPTTGKKYKHRCRDNEKLWNEHTGDDGLIKIHPSALERIVSKIVNSELEKRNQITEGLKKEQVARLCHANGYSTTEEFLKRQNAFVQSSKGDLGKKPSK